MLISVQTKFNHGDTVYYLKGHEAIKTTVKYIHCVAVQPDSIGIRYMVGGYESIHEDDLYTTLEEVKNSIKVKEIKD